MAGPPIDTSNPLSGSGAQGLAPPAPGPNGQDPGGIAATAPPTVIMPSTVAPKFRAAMAEAARRQGQPYLAHADPTAILMWRTFYGLTEPQAQAAALSAAQSANTGTPLTDQQLDQLATSIRGTNNNDPFYGAGDKIRASVQDNEGPGYNGADDPRLLGAIIAGAQAGGATITAEQARDYATQGYAWTHAGQGELPADYGSQLVGQYTDTRVPNPNQINPMVWDSLGPTGQGLALSLAKMKGWDAGEYTRQINADRPAGTAARRSTVDYGGLGTGVM